MDRFLRTRTLTLIWGFLVTYLFTQELIVAVPLFATMAIGNTLIMYFTTK